MRNTRRSVNFFADFLKLATLAPSAIALSCSL